jgi:inorganic pyrophosphatase
MADKTLKVFDRDFWLALDRLIADSELVIDRPKGSRHPRYSYMYPVDYGYLKDTSSVDGGGIDVWRGSDDDQRLDAIICTVDLVKKDSEIKLLIGCTNEEKQIIYDFHSQGPYMKGILIPRDQEWEVQ